MWKRKSYFFYLVLLSILSLSCSSYRNLLESSSMDSYEIHFISSGDNFPVIPIWEKPYKPVLLKLHKGILEQKISTAGEGLNQEEMRVLDTLLSYGFAKKRDGVLYPSVSVIHTPEGKRFFRITRQISKELAKIIVQKMPEVKAMYRELTVSSDYDYEALRFFLLSNVLLDNWQINNVEDQFLRSERTERHGKNYYLSFGENNKKDSGIEAFGIYGNQYICKGDYCWIIYGNRRGTILKELKDEDVGLYPRFTKQDAFVLSRMASVVTPDILRLLERNRSYFEKEYNASVYVNEIQFEEYFIWLYHFIYTQATNYLAKWDVVSIPPSGNFIVVLDQTD